MPAPSASTDESLNPSTIPASTKLVIGLLLGSTFVVILNETLMGVAIPTLIDSLGITASLAQWLTTAFMLTLAVVIPITGYLLQRFQTRPMFLLAMSLFTLGTVIGAIAPGFEVLLLARVVQAAGTGIIFPLLFTTVFGLVPADRRGRVVGLISTVIAVAPALGPSVSGLILSFADWRWLFITMIPLSVASLVIGAIRVVNVGEPRPGRLDVLSVLLSIPGFGGLVFGLAQLGEAGREAEGDVAEATTAALTALAIGLVALGLFVWRQLVLQRTDAALLDLRTFAQRQFAMSIAIVMVAAMALFGAIILIPLFVQDVMGATALISGLIILPGALLQGLLAPWIGRRYDAVGPRSLVLPGAVLLTVSMWGMAMLTATTPLWLIAAANIGLSLGLALLFTPLLTNGLSALPPQLNSHGSAIVGTVQQVAGAAGIALFISVAAAFGGADPTEASVTEEGVRAAFTVGAIIATFTIPAVLFVRRTPTTTPEPHGDDSPAAAAH
ncbi:MAG: DHA2 family efflux MFS transporter permease subunit [Microcella sp.]|uniref:DHA2 family efflux MFS transporter permease subunit n=1 Tax=Microcella sp. TaxID=1913979 RepID=UPI0024C730CF|nr:DHA2 family efflux MFS transporter permease subunit [Microcella sp.]UYN84845.1 MAG: DHA2 family efflux MFS transporter permease subunit [Microcella sp.]